MTWFDLYKDTALQTMIKATLDSNRDLLTAAARIEEARLQNFSYKGESLATVWIFRHRQVAARPEQMHKKLQEVFEGGFFNAFGVLNWELDLWGKVRHAKRSAVAQYLASVQNRNALQVSLVGRSCIRIFFTARP